MGVMRFRVSPPGFLDGWPEAEQAYISGFDGRVFPTRVEREGDELVCRRPSSDSGRLHVAWPVPRPDTAMGSAATSATAVKPTIMSPRGMETWKA